jgi:prepilin-type N-terminal cleavage/methylation domain-containing protein
MRPKRFAAAGRARGYTLIELLVVMGIITLLAALMLPAIAHGLLVVQIVKTQSLISQLCQGLERFNRDHGLYPPSDTAHGAASGMTNGSMCLGYYLMGKEGKGWIGEGPFGAAGSSDRWGPYFEYEGALGGAINDTFNPGKAIFYFRAERGEANEFDAADNGPLDTSDPPDTAFKSQAHLDVYAQRPDPTDPGRKRWLMVPYLLISPGADRYYGYVKKDPTTGNYSAVTTTTDPLATCDDITNFTYR